MFKRFVLTIFILLILPLSVSADFTMGSSTGAIDTCSSDTSLILVTTTNIGSSADSYNIGLSGDVAKWSIVAPQGFVLQPGGSQNSYVYITVPSNTRSGDYELRASVSSNSGGQQTQSYALKVGACDSVEVTPVAPSSVDMCTCTSGAFEFLIKNTGRWAENYQLSLTGSGSKWATLSDNVINLDAGEAKSVTVSAEPTCGETGDFGITLTASAVDGSSVGSASANLGVNGCYDFDFATSENYLSFCDNSEAKVPINVQNKGTENNAYTLNVDGPTWASFDKKRLTVGAGKVQSTNLILSPSFNVAGNFPMTITTISEQGNIEKTDTFTANIRSCRSVNVELSQDTDVLCGGNSKSYELSVVNAGEFDEKYALSVGGVTWAKLSDNFVSLNSGASALVNLEVSPEVGVESGTYLLTVDASSQTLGASSSSDEISIEISPRASCFGVQLEAEKTNLELSHGEGILVPIVINNIGSADANYELELSGDGASLSQLNPGVVELAGNSAETVYLHLSAPDDVKEGSYQVTVAARSVEDQTVSGSSTISFKIITSDSSLPKTSEVTSEANSGDNGAVGEGIISKSISSVSSAASSVGSKAMSAGRYAWSYVTDVLFKYWHIALIILGVLLLIIVVLRFGIFKREDDWFEEFEDLFDDDDEELEKKEDAIESDSKPETKEKSKGLVGRFMAWLTEEDDFDDFDFEYEDVKPKKENKEGLLSKFKSWLEEDDPETKPATKKTKVKKKANKKSTKSVPAKKVEGRGFVSKLIDWLYEEEDPTKKPAKNSAKKASPKKSTKSKPTEKGVWDKFVDWLQDDDDAPVKSTQSVTKKVTKSKSKSKIPSKSSKKTTTTKKAKFRKSTSTRKKSTKSKK